MGRVIWNTTKVFVIFVACTCLFYYGLRLMHAEYEQYHRYDKPSGQAVKVFQAEEKLMERLNLFFRLGE